MRFSTCFSMLVFFARINVFSVNRQFSSEGRRGESLLTSHQFIRVCLYRDRTKAAPSRPATFSSASRLSGENPFKLMVKPVKEGWRSANR